MKEWERIDAKLKRAGIRIAPPTPCSTDGPRSQCPSHVPQSEHYAGRARDYGDHASDCIAIANYLRPFAKGPDHVLDELFYAPTHDWWKNGKNLSRSQIGDHDDHVHAGKVVGREFPIPSMGGMDMAQIADAKACPQYGSEAVWVLGSDGSINAYHGAPYRGGMNGSPDFVNRMADHLEVTDDGTGYMIVDTADERYGPDGLPNQ